MRCLFDIEPLFCLFLSQIMVGLKMPKRQAVKISSLNIALERDCPIVLKSPIDESSSLSAMFGDKADLSSAHMTTLEQWEKPPRKDGKIYGHIESKDWHEFKQNLDRVISAGKADKLLIEYEGQITNYRNATMFGRPDDEAGLLSDLQNGGAGNALSDNKGMVIGFPRFFNSASELSVKIPYASQEDSELQWQEIDTKSDNPEPYRDNYSDICND